MVISFLFVTANQFRQYNRSFKIPYSKPEAYTTDRSFYEGEDIQIYLRSKEKTTAYFLYANGNVVDHIQPLHLETNDQNSIFNPKTGDITGNTRYLLTQLA